LSVDPSVIIAAVIAARPSLPSGSFCDPTLNQIRKQTVGSFFTGTRTALSVFTLASPIVMEQMAA
jgi:hypothetical protein